MDVTQIVTNLLRANSKNLNYNPICLFGVIFILLSFVGCQDNNEDANLLLNENEISFNEKLISITQNGSDYYIGTESSGRIYVYSSEKSIVIDTLDTDCGRIYQVKQTKDVDTFYVGTQNMGLKKMHRNGKRLEEYATFIIKGKKDRYSCYDVFIDNEAIYAMTSHGIYQVVQSDTLKPIYAFFVDGFPDPFVASNMVKGGSYYFGATTKGLVRITPIINDTTTILPQKNIKNVVCYNDTIYALGDSLYRIEPDSSKVIDAFGLKAPAKIYYRADGINYFLSDNYLTLAHDTTLLGSQPELHKKVGTRRQLSVDGHNNMIADSKDYSLLVTDHALWQVGHHLPSVFGELKEGGVKLACIDKSSIYFLVGKKVYKLDSGIVAKEVLELNEKGDINLMECSLDGDSLYYVNRDNVVYRQSINTPWYKFWPDLADSIGKPEKEITAMCIHNSVSGAILALRDSLIYMAPNSTNAIKLIAHDKKEVSFPYIRRFTVGDSIFAPTMNDGLFSGKGKKLYIVKGTENLRFIRDVACSDSSNSLYILTNRHLFLGNDSVIDNSNFGSRLLVSGKMIFIPGEVGGVRVIQLGKNNKIVTDSIRFPDVSFRAESSWVLDSIVYLGGQSGVIALNSNNGNSNFVKFEDKTPFPFFLLLLTLSLFIILFWYLLWLRERIINKRRRRKKIQDQAKKFESWLDAIDDENIKKRINTFIEKSSKKNITKIIDDLENESESIVSSVARFLQEEKKQAVRLGIERQIERLRKRFDILMSYMQENIDAAQILHNDVNTINDRINNLKNENSVNIQDAIDEISKEISDRFVILSDNYWKEFHQESLNGRIRKLLVHNIFTLLDKSLQSEIVKIQHEVGTLQDLDKNEKKAKSNEIGNKLDTITIKVTLALRKKSEELKSEYLEMAKNNGSKEEEKNDDNSFTLSAEIDFYKKWIDVEKKLEPYIFIFEEKLKPYEKEHANYPEEYRPITEELHQTDKLREIIKTNLDSQFKLAELEKILLENQEEILGTIIYHIDNRLISLEKLCKEEQDVEIANRLKTVFEELKKEAQSFSIRNVEKIFELINKVTRSDGRLLMFNQMITIRKIAMHKVFDEIKKTEIKSAIDMFYRPVFTYHIDWDVYKQLLECTKNENYSPKDNEKGSHYVQQPFYILAVAMAKKDNLKRKSINYALFFPQKPKSENKEPKGPNSSSISRAKGFVRTWIDSTYAKQLDISDSPLYASVLAYYLSGITSSDKE